jgi:hypothetical protein
MGALRRQALGIILIAVGVLAFLIVRHWGHLHLHVR